MKNRVVVAVVVTVAGIGLLTARTSRHLGQGATPNRDREDGDRQGGGSTNANLAAEMASLQQRLARMEQAERARGQSVGKDLGADAAEAARVAADKQLQEKVKRYYTPELEAKLFTGYFNGLDNARRAEGTDLPWAQDIQASVRQSFKSGGRALSSLSADSVDCGRTLCRVELKASDAALKNGALAEFLQKMGPQLPQVSVFVAQNSNQMTAYFARPGVDLPPMESPEHLVADLP